MFEFIENPSIMLLRANVYRLTFNGRTGFSDSINAKTPVN